MRKGWEAGIIYANKIEDLKKAVDDYIAFIESGLDSRSDYKEEIFEKAVELFGGPDIWTYINATIDKR